MGQRSRSRGQKLIYNFKKSGNGGGGDHEIVNTSVNVNVTNDFCKIKVLTELIVFLVK